jgi:ABC-type antimicrobial peptide transport system permease subunit
LYISEQRVAGLSKYFATIAILISCLGLFGLVAFAAERRVKEIGIRKTFGASEYMIVRMLSGDFTKMLLVSIAITLPVSYFLAGYWLESFAYRIALKWWFFAGAGVSALLIAWVIVGTQTIKAARANPVESLRSE